MKYRMYTGDQPILDAFQTAGIVRNEDMKHLKRQDFEADSDEDAVEKIEDYMKHTGIPVRAITRIGEQDEEIIVHRFGN